MVTVRSHTWQIQLLYRGKTWVKTLANSWMKCIWQNTLVNMCTYTIKK